MIGYWHDTVVRLSVCLWRNVLRPTIGLHRAAKVSEQVTRKWPLGTRLYFTTPYKNLSPQTLHLLNRRSWCHMANTLKLYCYKRTAEIYTPGIALSSCCTAIPDNAVYDRLIPSNSWATCWKWYAKEQQTVDSGWSPSKNLFHFSLTLWLKVPCRFALRFNDVRNPQ